MNCEDIGLLLDESLEQPETAAARRVREHLEGCAPCQDALRAVSALRAQRHLAVPAPRPDAFRRAMRRAAGAGGDAHRRRGEFRRGLAVGATAAAGVAVVAAILLLSGGVSDGDAWPAVTLALHEPQDISIAIESPAPLQGAEIQVTLRGAVDLRGYAGQRDIQWTADLEQGVNRLTLPVLATGEQGGQVQVVVTHGKREKTFLVDVTTRQPQREQEDDRV